MASFQKIKTYAWREVKALCVLLILLIKSLVLKKREQVNRHVSIRQSKRTSVMTAAGDHF